MNKSDAIIFGRQYNGSSSGDHERPAPMAMARSDKSVKGDGCCGRLASSGWETTIGKATGVALAHRDQCPCFVGLSVGCWAHIFAGNGKTPRIDPRQETVPPRAVLGRVCRCYSTIGHDLDVGAVDITHAP